MKDNLQNKLSYILIFKLKINDYYDYLVISKLYDKY